MAAALVLALAPESECRKKYLASGLAQPGKALIAHQQSTSGGSDTNREAGFEISHGFTLAIPE